MRGKHRSNARKMIIIKARIENKKFRLQQQKRKPHCRRTPTNQEKGHHYLKMPINLQQSRMCTSTRLTWGLLLQRFFLFFFPLSIFLSLNTFFNSCYLSVFVARLSFTLAGSSCCCHFGVDCFFLVRMCFLWSLVAFSICCCYCLLFLLLASVWCNN